jgi:hypothetical protein
MLDDTRERVMTDLVSVGSRGNVEPVNTSIPEAIMDEVKKITYDFLLKIIYFCDFYSYHILP